MALMLRLLLGWSRDAVLRAALAAVALAVLVTGSVIVSTAPAQDRPGEPVLGRLAAHTHWLTTSTSVLAGAPDQVAEGVASKLLAAAPVIVVTRPDQPASLAAAARSALRAHAPLLLLTAERTNAGQAISARSPGPASAALRSQIREMRPRAVLATGTAGSALAAELPGIHVVSSPAALPATGVASPALSRLALLVRSGPPDAATLAAVTTAHAAGARVITVRGGDPRADPAAVAALRADQPRQVLAIGTGFGPASLLASRIAVARTGVQLPGGAQVLFPGHLVVALYGHPGTPGLGVLGHQDLSASIARARQVAAPYRKLSNVPVVPAFEIIATVAEGSPGPDGDYSYATPVAILRPWVRRATAAGMYVILDLQPGRASLLAQAKKYQSLLELPGVGLALDAEWKLQPGQKPLRQIGSVSIGEVNSVVRWLAGLTARHRLPQKLLVLHQFRLSMIRDERALDTSHDDLAILFHMDGQGAPAVKQQTWAAVTRAAPRGVFFGWKDFYVKDHPMLDPRRTITRTPRLSMISYQ
jgi:predicted O-methyltransferase YrrM